jgi:hypothetical protein
VEVACEHAADLPEVSLADLMAMVEARWPGGLG